MRRGQQKGLWKGGRGWNTWNTERRSAPLWGIFLSNGCFCVSGRGRAVRMWVSQLLPSPVWENSVVLSPLYFITHLFIEHYLCAGHYSRCWRYSSNQKRHNGLLQRTDILVRVDKCCEAGRPGVTGPCQWRWWGVVTSKHFESWANSIC